MESPLTRFTATVDDYHRHRPSYPPALLDWIERTAGVRAGARVLDLGCGTGIAARLFAARGLRVVGVDPNAAMLAQARAAGGARWIRGRVERLGLAPRSFDLAVAGQAFHWFELAPALAEVERALRPGAWCCAFWNVRLAAGLGREYDALLGRHSSEYRALQSGRDTLAELRAALAGRERAEARFDWPQRLDRAGLLGRARSSSYVAHGLDDPAAFECALGELFERHASGGEVALEYETRAFAWRGSSPPDHD